MSGSDATPPSPGRASRRAAGVVDRPAAVGDGVVRLRRETKGRGGKAVTIVSGVPLAPDALKALAKTLKQKCGVGGAVKNTEIEIQGDQRAVLKPTLEKLGYTVKLAGG